MSPQIPFPAAGYATLATELATLMGVTFTDIAILAALLILRSGYMSFEVDVR